MRALSRGVVAGLLGVAGGGAGLRGRRDQDRRGPPLSPPGGVETGQSLRFGMMVAVNDLNAAGGLLAKKVELVVEDTAGVPDKGVAAFERLVTKDIAGECWADDVMAAQIPQVFRVTVANSLVYTAASDWAKAAGFENIAIIGENSDWGLGVIDVC